MAAVSADVLVPRLEEKHDEPQEKKQKKTDEERQEEEDAPYREKVGLEKKQKKTDKEKEDVHYREKAGLPLDDELLSDNDDDDEDDDCFPGDLPEMTRAEYILYHQQVDESGVSNHRI